MQLRVGVGISAKENSPFGPNGFIITHAIPICLRENPVSSVSAREDGDSAAVMPRPCFVGKRLGHSLAG